MQHKLVRQIMQCRINKLQNSIKAFLDQQESFKFAEMNKNKVNFIWSSSLYRIFHTKHDHS